MRLKGGSIWGGYLTPYDKFVFGVNVGQKYLMENTTLGIPALIQSEGWHSYFFQMLPPLSSHEGCMDLQIKGQYSLLP